jgi:hypothetical protein
MKRLTIAIMVACCSFLIAQDAAGTYKLTGTSVRYTSVARQTTVASVHDVYGLGISTPVQVIPINTGVAQIMNGPYNEENLELGGAFLNVTFNEDGTGTVNEGSYYPTIDLDTETCVSAATVLPITDELIYTSNLTPNNYVQNVNVIGLSSLSPFAAANGGPGFTGGISLSQSSELDYFTFGQTAGAYGACLAGYYADGTVCDSSYPGNDCDFYEACASAGYASKGHDFETTPGNGVRDMYVEWHAIDGPLSQSGYGDDVLDPCEDNLCVANANTSDCFELDPDTGAIIPSPACSAELEAFDRILGVPYFPTTAMNADCGYSQDILGGSADVGAGLAGGVAAACESGVTEDGNGNGMPDVVDGCFALEGYGYPADQAATMAFVAACEQLGFDTATCTQLAALAQATIEATTICYDPYTHDFYPADSAEECADGYFFTNMVWDCYGLLALTMQPADLCAYAGDAYVAQCVVGDSANRFFYLMDASFSPWGGFLTANAAGYTACVEQTGDPSLCTQFLVNDGGHDFDPGNGVMDGRLTMEMDPLCVPDLQTREVYIDFDEIGECDHNGDANLDDIVNILDVVNVVQYILGNGELGSECNADINEDEIINILDVVAIVQSILGNRAADADMIEIYNNDNIVSMDANGYVGAIQMTLSHGSDFSIELTDNALVALYNTEGNTTTLMIVAPEDNELFTVTGDYKIEETIAANSSDYIDIVNPSAISLGEAYPNPFNPTTSFELQIAASGHVTMNVYNLMGQLVGTILDGNMSEGYHNITWDASNFSSGMYIVKAVTANTIATQKVMLVK